MNVYRYLLTAIVCFAVSCLITNAQSRLLNKVKEKAEDKIIENLFNENKDKDESNQSQTGQQSSATKSQSGNTKGEGLTNSFDVVTSIDDANKNYKSEDYSNARFSIRQAIQGIELEMGREVLESLPENIDGLAAQKDDDKVTSSGVGFVGLFIQRSYLNDDQQMDVVVANNSVWISSINMYLGTTAYASGNDQQYKQIQFQGNKGIIEFDESSGYKLSVPFGQTSILVINGINFNNEKQFTNACNNVKIDTVKNKLGEQ